MKMIEQVLDWLNIETSVLIQIGLSLFFIVLFFVFRRVVSGIVKRHGRKYNLDGPRIYYVLKLLNAGLFVILIIAVSFLWGVTVQGLSLYFASLFTVIGIGFFAQWSILSNITASIILFFYYPFKIGATVSIYDGDNSIVGKVLNITMFSVKVQLENGQVASYPNNLIIQKPVIELKKDKH